MNLPFDESDNKLLTPLFEDVVNCNHPLLETYNFNTLFVIRTDVFEKLLASPANKWTNNKQIIPTYADYVLVFATYKNGWRSGRLTRLSEFVFEFGSVGLGMDEFEIIKYRTIFAPYYLDEGPLQQQLLFLKTFNEWTAPRNPIINTHDGPNPSIRIS
jgi:hypothetical protein